MLPLAVNLRIAHWAGREREPRRATVIALMVLTVGMRDVGGG